MIIRTATIDDEDFVRDLAAEAFAPYGDYRPLLPRWLHTPGVMTYFAENSGESMGYLMLAFFKDQQALVGDILAIAVVAQQRGHGIGRMLLEHAISVCDQASERLNIRAVRLSVAETNANARRLFQSCGFLEIPGDFGTYEGGQRTIHMELPLKTADR